MTNTNLISKENITAWGKRAPMVWEDDRLYISANREDAGIYLKGDLFEVGVRYSIGFKARLVSGEVLGLAGFTFGYDVIAYQDEINIGSWDDNSIDKQGPLEAGKVYDYRLEITRNTEGPQGLGIIPNFQDYGKANKRTWKLELYDFQYTQLIEPEPEPETSIKVTPIRPEQNGNLVRIPSVEGVKYVAQSSGAVIRGLFALSGDMTIEAVAEEGYTLVGEKVFHLVYTPPEPEPEPEPPSTVRFPEKPSQEGYTLVIPKVDNVIYRNKDTGKTVSSRIHLHEDVTNIVAVAKKGYTLEPGVRNEWAFKRGNGVSVFITHPDGRKPIPNTLKPSDFGIEFFEDLPKVYENHIPAVSLFHDPDKGTPLFPMDTNYFMNARLVARNTHYVLYTKYVTGFPGRHRQSRLVTHYVYGEGDDSYVNPNHDETYEFHPPTRNEYPDSPIWPYNISGMQNQRFGHAHYASMVVELFDRNHTKEVVEITSRAPFAADEKIIIPEIDGVDYINSDTGEFLFGEAPIEPGQSINITALPKEDNNFIFSLAGKNEWSFSYVGEGEIITPKPHRDKNWLTIPEVEGVLYINKETQKELEGRVFVLPEEDLTITVIPDVNSDKNYAVVGESEWIFQHKSQMITVFLDNSIVPWHRKHTDPITRPWYLDYKDKMNEVLAIYINGVRDYEAVDTRRIKVPTGIPVHIKIESFKGIGFYAPSPRDTSKFWLRTYKIRDKYNYKEDKFLFTDGTYSQELTTSFTGLYEDKNSYIVMPDMSVHNHMRAILRGKGYKVDILTTKTVPLPTYELEAGQEIMLRETSLNPISGYYTFRIELLPGYTLDRPGTFTHGNKPPFIMRESNMEPLKYKYNTMGWNLHFAGGLTGEDGDFIIDMNASPSDGYLPPADSDDNPIYITHSGEDSTLNVYNGSNTELLYTLRPNETVLVEDSILSHYRFTVTADTGYILTPGGTLRHGVQGEEVTLILDSENKTSTARLDKIRNNVFVHQVAKWVGVNPPDPEKPEPEPEPEKPAEYQLVNSSFNTRLLVYEGDNKHPTFQLYGGEKVSLTKESVDTPLKLQVIPVNGYKLKEDGYLFIGDSPLSGGDVIFMSREGEYLYTLELTEITNNMYVEVRTMIDAPVRPTDPPTDPEPKPDPKPDPEVPKDPEAPVVPPTPGNETSDGVLGFNNVYKTSRTDLQAIHTAIHKVRHDIITGGYELSADFIDPYRYIINTVQFPFEIPITNYGPNDYITVGFHKLGYRARTLTRDKVSISLGDIYTPNKYNNAYDYSNTSTVIHLPYADHVVLDPNYVIDETINIEYVVDLYSGEATINLRSSFNNNNVFHSVDTLIGTKIPFIEHKYGEVIGSHKDSRSVIYNNTPRPFIEVIRNVPHQMDSIFNRDVTETVDQLGSVRGRVYVHNISLDLDATTAEVSTIKSILSGGITIK